jgi:hypothetical protein
MLEDLKEGRGQQIHHTVSTKKNTAKILKYYFGEGQTIFCGFSLLARGFGT